MRVGCVWRVFDCAVRIWRGGQAAPDEQAGADEGPDSHTRFAHDGHRDAGSSAQPKQLRDEAGPGFAHADLEGHEFEGDRDQPVGRLDNERGQQRGRSAKDQPQREVFLQRRRARGTTARARPGAASPRAGATRT